MNTTQTATLSGAIVVLAVVVFPAMTMAQDDVPAPKRVVVSPTVYVHTTDDVDTAAVQQAVRRGLVSYPVSHAHSFGVVTPDELVERIQQPVTYEQSVELQTLRTEMGMQNYKRLETREAIKNLRISVDGFRDLYYGLVAPEKYAEALMYLSLSYLEHAERQQVLEPVDVLEEMMLYDPTRVFKKGFYPAEVVKFYETARHSLEENLREGPLKVQNVDKLAELTQADYVAHANILPGEGDTHELVLHIYEAAERTHLPPAVMRLPGLQPTSVAEAANRLMSRQLTCEMEPVETSDDRVVESKGDSPWAIQLNFAWSSFLKLPGPEKLVPFNNYGASVTAEFALTQEFSLLTAVQILTSTLDRNAVLFEDFTTFRTFFGGELGLTFGDFRAAIAPLLEVSTHGDIVMCEGSARARSEECGDQRVSYSSDVLLGVNARPRVSYKILPALEFSIGGSGSFFFFPLSGRELNFPVSVETGLQYRF